MLQVYKVLPEEDEVSVNINGAIQGREHVRDEESLCGAHPEHVLHVLSLLILNHTIINNKVWTKNKEVCVIPADTRRHAS